MPSRPRRGGRALVLVLLVAAACGEPPTGAGSLVIAGLSGDDQRGTVNQPLPAPFVVRVRDRDGPVAGLAVAFTVAAGGGTLSAASVTTDADGLAATRLTLGSTPGRKNNVVVATLDGAAGSPVAFSASAFAVSSVAIGAVSADTLVEGDTVTITGEGFGAGPAANAVTIDGLRATVTAATPTSLTLVVPRSDCRPARVAVVQVAVDDEIATLQYPTRPAEYLRLAAGEQLIVRDPAEFCLHLDRAAAPEAYLVGVQAVSEAASSVTPVTLSAALAEDAIASAPLPTPRPPVLAAAGRVPPPPAARATRLARHREAEARLRELDRALAARDETRTTVARAAAAAAAVPPGARVGDTLNVNFPDIGGGQLCRAIPIRAVVRRVGTRGVWLEDVENPPGGYGPADWESLSARLDDPIYDAAVAHFGAPSDIDGNGRIAIVVTRQVNLASPGILGFVTSADLLPREACAASNGAELYYGRTPTAAAVGASAPYPVAQALADAPLLVAHELVHIIQYSRRLALGAPVMSAWETEGQATLAEEVVGHADEGRRAGANYGLAVAFNLDDAASTDWYSARFDDLAHYHGYESDATRVAGAPEQCSWLAGPPENGGPCLGGRDVYGLPSLFLRWLSDHFGPGYPGGEAGLQRDLIGSRDVGFANVSARVGVPIDTLLAQFAAMLYTDDRVAAPGPRLTLPSWNLPDIFEGSHGGTAPAPTRRLAPTERGFAPFGDQRSVRGASSSYHRLSGAARGRVAVRARGAGGGMLPAHMRLWVVRLQ